MKQEKEQTELNNTLKTNTKVDRCIKKIYKANVELWTNKELKLLLTVTKIILKKDGKDQKMS